MRDRAYATIVYAVTDERPRPVQAAVAHTNRQTAIADARALVSANGRRGTRAGAGVIGSTGLGVIYQGPIVRGRPESDGRGRDRPS